MGVSADVSMRPWSALLVGIVSGVVSVLGYVYIQVSCMGCMGYLSVYAFM